MDSHEIRNYLDQPMYSTAEASRLVGLTPNRISHWLNGYHYLYRSDIRKKPPIITARKGADKTSYASFLELVDLLVVKKFIEHNFSLQKIRKILQEVDERYGMAHFAHHDFFTDKKYVYTSLSIKHKDTKLKFLSGGQTVSWPVFEKIATKIEFDKTAKLAIRWYPLGRNKLVVVDPLISFGRPTIVNKGVPTSNVYSLYLAEDKDIKAPCEWHDLTEDEAWAAVAFEEKIAA